MDKLQQWWHATEQFLTTGQTWMFFKVFAVIFAALIVNFISSLFIRHLAKRFEKTKNYFDDAFLKALQRPLTFLIWVLGLTFAIQLLIEHQTSNSIFNAIISAREIFIVILVMWFLVRFITEVEHSMIVGGTGRKPVDRTTANAVAKLLRVSVFITSALVIMQTFGVGITSVLAFGGIAGAGVAFAAKDLLGNFFGGLVIYLDRPFSVGDWIRSPDRNIEGTVEYIGWRLTRIRTFDKRPLYVPNGVFNEVAVENPSRMTNRRIKTNIGVRYDDATKLADILSEVKDMLTNHPEIDTTQTMLVNFVNFGPSSLDFLIYTFTKTTDWAKFQNVQQDVFLKIIEIIDKCGAECAFPTQTVHVPEKIVVDNLVK